MIINSICDVFVESRWGLNTYSKVYVEYDDGFLKIVDTYNNITYLSPMTIYKIVINGES